MSDLPTLLRDLAQALERETASAVEVDAARKKLLWHEEELRQRRELAVKLRQQVKEAAPTLLPAIPGRAGQAPTGERPPGRIAKKQYCDALGVDQGSLSPHRRTLEPAVDAAGWMDEAMADELLAKHTRPGSALHEALKRKRAAADPAVVLQAFVSTDNADDARARLRELLRPPMPAREGVNG